MVCAGVRPYRPFTACFFIVFQKAVLFYTTAASFCLQVRSLLSKPCNAKQPPGQEAPGSRTLLAAMVHRLHSSIKHGHLVGGVPFFLVPCRFTSRHAAAVTRLHGASMRIDVPFLSCWFPFMDSKSISDGHMHMLWNLNPFCFPARRIHGRLCHPLPPYSWIGRDKKRTACAVPCCCD